MRVLLIARSLSRTSVGGDVYVRGLIQALSTTPVELVVAVPSEVLDEAALWAPSAQFLTVPPSRGAVRVVRDLFGVHRLARRVNPDWVIYPHEFAPLTTYPVAIVLQNIAAFSDLSRREMGLRGVLLRELTRMRIGAGDIVVTSSVIAADIVRGSVRRLPPVEWIRPCLQFSASPYLPLSKDLRRGKVLVVLGPWRYKNPGIIRQAMALLRRRDPLVADGLQVRVVGTTEFNFEGVRNMGVLEREELLKEMAHSALVVFPSLVESLGLPALEAASIGVQPAVMAGTAMSELLKTSAVTFAGPLDLAELFQKVARGAVYDVAPRDREALRQSLSATAVGDHWIETLTHRGSR